MNYCIKAIEYYLPEKIITNLFLNQECAIDIKFLEDKIGIKERRAVAQEETTSDLAEKACEKLIEINGITKSEIDFLLVCTENPDYRIPGVAGMIQHRLDLPKSCFAFDINLGCSGFVYSLAIAGNFIQNRSASKAIIIMADVYTKILDYKDRATAGIFGDASAAILIESCHNDFGYIDGVFGTDGSKADRLILPNSSIVNSIEQQKTLFMDGQEIFKFAVKVVPESINSLLANNNLNREDIRFYVFHQANQYILNELKRRLRLQDEQVIIDFKYCGNTVSSSIPIAFKNLLSKNCLNRGDLIVFCGFGVGLSWGSVLYKYL